MTLLPPNSSSDLLSYEQRGWPAFEMAISSWITNPLKQLDFSRLGEAHTVLASLVKMSWQGVHAKCLARRPQPLSPASFEKVLESRQFTNGSDKIVVNGLYKNVFCEVCCSACMQLTAESP